MEDVHSVAGARDALRQRLRTALGTGSFGYHYQPIVTLPGGRLWGVEALLRWNDAGRWRSAADFVPVAASLGILPGITYETLDELGSCTLPELLAPVGPDVVLCLNLSPSELADDAIHGLLADGPIGELAHRVMLELAPMSLRVYQELRGGLDVLRSVGYRVAIDNSGRTWPARDLLARVDPDVVKVDTRALHPGHLDPGSLRGVNRLNSALGTVVAGACGGKSIAVSVSSRELEIRALNSGVALGQGVHLAPPMDLIDLRDWAGREAEKA